MATKVGQLAFDQKKEDIIAWGSNGSTVFKGFYYKDPTMLRSPAGDNENKKKVAIKRIQWSYVESDESTVNREVKLMLEIGHHPNILRYICFEKDVYFLYIATELCIGTLDYFFNGKYDGLKKGLIDEREILSQVTRGLSYLHSLRIVHRDIKPTNILIFVPSEEAESKPQMKLADFDISKILKTNRNDFTNTSVSNPNGTKGWMPPEVYKEKRLDFKVDVWALGCIFAYILCEGKHPFGDGDVLERIDRIRKEKAMSMKKEDMKYPHGFDVQAFAVIKLMLKADPFKRPTVENVLKHPFFMNKEDRSKYFKELWSSFKDSITNNQKVQLEKVLPEDKVGLEIHMQNTPLHILGQRSDNVDLIDLIKLLIKKGTDVNAENFRGNTPLHLLCNYYKKDNDNMKIITQLLIDNGADVNAQNKDGSTPLHSFCKNGFKSNQNFNRMDMFHLLIANGADVNAKENYKATPLHLLFENEKNNDLVDIFHLLREKGADVMAKDHYGNTPLHSLCSNNKKNNMIDRIKLLTEESKYGAGADVNAQKNYGETPLHLLCESYQSDDLKDILKFLIKERNANVNAKNEIGQTPLHYLCENNQEDNLVNAIKALIHEGVQVNANDYYNRAPLNLLCGHHGNNNFIESVQLLIEEKADVNAPDKNGSTPLHYLCKNRYKNDNLIAVFQLFIQKNVDVNVKDKVGNTPLHVLFKYYTHDNLINIVQLLVLNGAQVNTKNNNGSTPLHSLCAKYYYDNLISIVQFFIKYEKEEDGNTPPYLLRWKYHSDNLINIVKLLVDNGAEVNIRDNKGNTPLHKVLSNPGKFPEDTVEHVFKRGANVNAKNIRELEEHCKIKKIVQRLIDNDGRVNVQDKYGNTPPHNLCRNHHMGNNGNDLMSLRNIVVLFEKYGASMGATNDEGITPNDYLIRRNQLINMLAMELTNRVAIDVPKNPITKDEDTTECSTTAGITEALPAQEPLPGPSSAHDGEFIRPGPSRKRKRSNHSIPNVHQNSNTVPPVPNQLEPAVLPYMVSETPSNPQLNQEPMTD